MDISRRNCITTFLLALILTSCQGVFDDYDTPTNGQSSSSTEIKSDAVDLSEDMDCQGASYDPTTQTITYTAPNGSAGWSTSSAGSPIPSDCSVYTKIVYEFSSAAPADGGLQIDYGTGESSEVSFNAGDTKVELEIEEATSDNVSAICLKLSEAGSLTLKKVYLVKSSTVRGQLYIDASSYTNWYYVDLPAILKNVLNDSKYDVSSSVVSSSIPLTSTGDAETTRPTQQLTGKYTYWFDIYNGGGLTHNEFRSFTPTDAQTDPSSWTIAIHRNNVRTNGCSAYETQQTDINAVTKSDYADATLTEDEWNENQVWVDLTTMLNELVPSQGIRINPVLSSWLTMDIPPMPPRFNHNNHVFILKLPDGTYAALQSADYISPKTGTKCCMTIKFKYPL